jgi:hypothetical protein
VAVHTTAAAVTAVDDQIRRIQRDRRTQIDRAPQR